MTHSAKDGRTPIVYLTARYPPMTSSGTFRVEAVMDYLPDHGFDVTAVTLPSAWVAQQSRIDQPHLQPESRVLRPEAPSDRLIRAIAAVPGIRWILREALIPDLLLPWARYVGKHFDPGWPRPALVYATGPPFSALVAGRLLARRLKVPLVLEIRDPPSFNRRLRFRSRLARRRMSKFEVENLTQADAVIAVTQGTRNRLLQLHPELRSDQLQVVTNGYPEVKVDPSLSGRDPTKYTVAYIGSFQGDSVGSPFNPEIVLPGLNVLPVDSARLRIVGPVTPSQRKRFASQTMVEMVGPVSRHQALAEVATADLVLVLAEDDPWWIGRKVFEAIAFAKRILAIVPKGDTSDLLSGFENATVLDLAELERLPEVLQSTYQSWLANEPRTPKLRRDVQTDRSCVAQIAQILTSVLDRNAVPQ